MIQMQITEMNQIVDIYMNKIGYIWFAVQVSF